MEVAGEEVDNQQAMRSVEAHVLAPKIDDIVEYVAHDSTERARAVSNPTTSTERAGEHVLDKRKGKVDEKMKS